MAWNEKALRRRQPKRQLDQFDLEAEAEGNAIRTGPHAIGPVGKKVKSCGGRNPRGEAIIEARSLSKIEIRTAV